MAKERGGGLPTGTTTLSLIVIALAFIAGFAFPSLTLVRSEGNGSPSAVQTSPTVSSAQDSSPTTPTPLRTVTSLAPSQTPASGVLSSATQSPASTGVTGTTPTPLVSSVSPMPGSGASTVAPTGGSLLPTPPIPTRTPTPTLGPSPTATPTPRLVHTIVSGDNIWDLSRRYGVTPEAILAANKGLDPQKLAIGQKINIP